MARPYWSGQISKAVDLMSALRQSLAAKTSSKASGHGVPAAPARGKLKPVHGKRRKTA